MKLLNGVLAFVATFSLLASACGLVTLNRNLVTLNQSVAIIAAAAQKQAVAPVVPENSECHESLRLFDELIRKELKTGGSGRK
jgi:hypothetical protein